MRLYCCMGQDHQAGRSPNLWMGCQPVGMGHRVRENQQGADLQAAYQRLIDERRLTKKAMCDLCIPFRDKYGLKDSQALRIARNEMDLQEMADLLEGQKDEA